MQDDGADQVKFWPETDGDGVHGEHHLEDKQHQLESKSWFQIAFLHVRVNSGTGHAGTSTTWDSKSLMSVLTFDALDLETEPSDSKGKLRSDVTPSPSNFEPMSARFLLCRTTSGDVPSCDARDAFLQTCFDAVDKKQRHAAGAPSRVFLNELHIKCNEWSLSSDIDMCGFFGSHAAASHYAVSLAVDSFCETAKGILARLGSARVDLSHLFYVVECVPMPRPCLSLSVGDDAVSKEAQPLPTRSLDSVLVSIIDGAKDTGSPRGGFMLKMFH
jgi:hypothetical protein